MAARIPHRHHMREEQNKAGKAILVEFVHDLNQLVNREGCRTTWDRRRGTRIKVAVLNAAQATANPLPSPLGGIWHCDLRSYGAVS